MKFCILSSSALDNSDKKNLILQYQTHLDSPQRMALSVQRWEKIKQNKNTLYSLDDIFFIANDGCFSPQEITSLSKMLQYNRLLRFALLDAFNDTTLEKQITINLDEFLNSDAKVLELAIEAERKRGLQSITHSLFGNSTVSDLVNKCSDFVFRLSDAVLRDLVLKNSPAIVLLNVPELSKRFNKILCLNDVVALFTKQLADWQDEQLYAQTLLNFCREHSPRYLPILFRLINEASSTCDTLIPDSRMLKKRILSYGSGLERLYEENTALFLEFVQDFENLSALFDVIEKPFDFIALLVKKDSSVAEWVITHLLIIVASLLERKKPTMILQIVNFLKRADLFDKIGATFGMHLSRAVNDILNKFEPTYATENNAVFTILGCAVIRNAIQFSDEQVWQLFTSKQTALFADHMISGDSDLWQYFQKKQGHNDHFFQENIYCRQRNYYSNFSVDINRYQRNNMQATAAYVVTNSALWHDFKKIFPKHTVKQVESLHPILKIKLAYDAKNNDDDYQNFLVQYFLSPQGLELFLSDKECITLFCTIATGQQYIECLQQLREFLQKAFLQSPEKSWQIRQLTENLIKLITQDFYFSTKLAAVLNVENLIYFQPYFDVAGLRSLVSSYLLIEYITLQSVTSLKKFLNQVSKNSELVINLCRGLNQIDFNQSSELFSEVISNDSMKMLFKKLTNTEVIDILNDLSDSLRLHMLNLRFMSEKIIEIIVSTKNSLNLTIFMFKNIHQLESIKSKISDQNLLQLLTLPSICLSEDATFHIINAKTEAFTHLVTNREKVLSVIKSNYHFAALLFHNEELFNETCLNVEDCIAMALDTACAKTMGKFQAEKSIKFLNFTVITNYFHLLPVPVQHTLMNRYACLNVLKESKLSRRLNFSPRLNVYDREFDLITLEEFSAQIAELNQKIDTDFFYRGLFGKAAVILRQIHIQLALDFSQVQPTLFKAILNDWVEFSADKFPVLLLFLDDSYYSSMLNLIAVKTIHHILLFIQNLNPDFNNYHCFFNLDLDADQINFVRFLYRLKTLLIRTIAFYQTQLTSEDDSFYGLLILAAQNAPEMLSKLLDKQDFLKIALKLCQHDCSQQENKVLVDGEITLRLLILSHLDHFEISKNDTLLKQVIYQQLNCLPTQICLNSQYNYSLFPFEKLVTIKDKNLTAYFLRQKDYVSNLSVTDLLGLISKNKELLTMLLIYPHLYLKLNNQELIQVINDLQDGIETELSTIKEFLAQNPCYASVLVLHSLFENKESTHNKAVTQFFKTPVFFDLSQFSKKLQKNPLLKSIDEQKINVWLQQITKKHVEFNAFHILQLLIMLVIEPDNEDLSELTSLFSSLLAENLTLEVKNWRVNYVVQAENLKLETATIIEKQINDFTQVKIQKFPESSLSIEP